MSVAGVVLAAGSSTRLGRSKQTLVIDESMGETLAERAVRVAMEAGLSPVVAVVRPEGDFGFGLQQRGAMIVLNDRAAEGMASSIRLGTNVAKLLKADGAVLMTCDQVMVRPEHLRALYADAERVTASRYAGRVGVPAYFPAAVFGELMKLTGDAGARELLRDAVAIVDEELALDVDTEEDVRRAQERLRRG